MLKAVIFDMDGVLVDTERFYFQRRMKYFNEHQIEPGSRDEAAYFGLSNENVWRLLVPDEQQRTKIKTDYEAHLKQLPINYVDHLNEGVIETLDTLERGNIKIALASAGQKNEIERMLYECYLDHYFSQVLSGEELAHNKPHPEIYQVSVEKLGFQKSECLAIEDSPTGILSAKQAGLTVWAKQAEVNQTQADQIFNHFGTLNEYFKSII